MQKFAVGETRTARIGALVSAVFLAVVIATAAGTSVDAGTIGVSLAFIGLDILQVAPVVVAVSFVMAAFGAVVGRHGAPRVT